MTRRRSGAPRRWAIIASALVALSVAGLAIADAAQLNVSGDGLFAAGATRCTNGPIATTGGSTHVGSVFTSVELGSVAAECAGQAVQVTVYDSAGAVLAEGSGTASAGSFDIATTSFPYSAVAGVALLFDTWGVPTAWTAPVVPMFTCIVTDNLFAPLVPAQFCTLKNITFSTGTSGGHPTVTVNFRVNSPAGNLRFLVSADFGVTSPAPAFPGWTPLSVSTRVLTAQSPSVCGSLPFFTARGINNAANGTRTFRIYGTTRANYTPNGNTRICPAP